MSVLKRFFDKKSSQIPVKPAPHNVEIDCQLDDSSNVVEILEEIDGKEEEDLGYAEGQSFIIQYTDAKAQVTTRRITVWGLKLMPDGVPALVATCHERNATRTFKISGIREAYDYDGVSCGSVPEFLEETFGMAPDLARLSAQAAEIENQSTPELRKFDALKSAKQIARENGTHLLWCLANSDGDFHPSEHDCVLNYLLNDIGISGIYLTEADLKKLQKHLLNLRPTGKTIDRSIEFARGFDDYQMHRFLAACLAVIQADGEVDETEKQAINTISFELVGEMLFD